MLTQKYRFVMMWIALIMMLQRMLCDLWPLSWGCHYEIEGDSHEDHALEVEVCP